MEAEIKKHLSFLRRINYRKRSIDARRTALERYKRWLNIEQFLWDQTSRADIEKYLSLKELAPSTLAHEIAHIRGFYSWAVEIELISENPTLKIQRPKVPIGTPRPMSDIDREKALQRAPERIRPWLYLAAYAGLRACEIAQLKGEDILWHQNPPILIICEQKGGDTGAIPLHPILLGILRSLPNKGYLFPKYSSVYGAIEGTAVSAAQVVKLTNHFLKSIGITSTLHQLRHWFGTNCYLTSGRDLRLTQELMRHKSPVSTAIYTYIDQSDKANIVASLPG